MVVGEPDVAGGMDQIARVVTVIVVHGPLDLGFQSQFVPVAVVGLQVHLDFIVLAEQELVVVKFFGKEIAQIPAVVVLLVMFDHLAIVIGKYKAKLGLTIGQGHGRATEADETQIVLLGIGLNELFTIGEVQLFEIDHDILLFQVDEFDYVANGAAHLATQELLS